MEERKKISWEKEETYRRIYKPELKLIDGLPAFLAKLKKQGYPLAIGSAAPPGNVDFVLDNLDIRNLFDCVMHSDDVEKGKPNPEIYLKLTEHLGLNPQECLVFEDTPAERKLRGEQVVRWLSLRLRIKNQNSQNSQESNNSSITIMK